MESTPPIPPMKSRVVIQVLSLLRSDFRVWRAMRAVVRNNKRNKTVATDITERDIMKYSFGRTSIQFWIKVELSISLTLLILSEWKARHDWAALMFFTFRTVLIFYCLVTATIKWIRKRSHYDIILITLTRIWILLYTGTFYIKIKKHLEQLLTQIEYRTWAALDGEKYIQ